mmetsp:Transcript_30540/g.57546  ORF Transcript_30540/g.57546 Transcript_30540/m.57546 type:complete len:260 (-) Transcript_30540:739-1518(-)
MRSTLPRPIYTSRPGGVCKRQRRDGTVCGFQKQTTLAGAVSTDSSTAKQQTISIRPVRVRDAWGAVDCHTEVFSKVENLPSAASSADNTLGRFIRAARLLRMNELERKDDQRQASVYLPSCANHFTTLVAVDELHSSSPPPPLLAEVLDVVLNQKVNWTPEAAMGLIVVETMTEFAPPRTRLQGIPDPQYGPRRKWRRQIGYISDLAVRSSMRRTGIASQLLRSAENQASQWGCRFDTCFCVFDIQHHSNPYALRQCVS